MNSQWGYKRLAIKNEFKEGKYMGTTDRIVKMKEFMQILGCKKSEFYARFKKMSNFPEDTGVYMKMQSWWLSDVIRFIEELKK